ncbi:hypothetical protein N7532_002953 [Penicillium argentinense]|uniref:Uncharacterized protein n=1 Tax=Penicillium argentinense TaxID=1131581 RepID=A0A9W9KLW7_9EURO|nr:uncharacterized protein N7532_002953 [Penicillium argentinense]KAJ5110308.1 hypothetical protein N7532_002953 [Penicillium argentinense]
MPLPQSSNDLNDAIATLLALGEGRKDIIRLQGVLLHELPAAEYFTNIHIFGSELISSLDRNILKQSGYEQKNGDQFLLAGEVTCCGKGPLRAQFVTDHGISPFDKYRDFCQRFSVEKATGRRRIHIVIRRPTTVELAQEDSAEHGITFEDDDVAPVAAVAPVAPVEDEDEDEDMVRVATVALAPSGRANSSRRRQRTSSPVRRSQRNVRRRM